MKKHPGCLGTLKWIEKMWDAYMVEYKKKEENLDIGDKV